MIGISTHALTEGDKRHFLMNLIYCISTHALTEGDLSKSENNWNPDPVFQLTPSRRATLPQETEDSKEEISTHALTEGDCIFDALYY